MSKRIEVIIHADASELILSLERAEAQIRFPELFAALPEAALAIVQFESAMLELSEALKAPPPC